MNKNYRVELKKIVSHIKNTIFTFMFGFLPVDEMGYDKNGTPVEELVAAAKFARDKKTGRFISKKP